MALDDRLMEQFLANVRPSSRQLALQQMQMYAFIHFGMNTYTDREWGLGGEDPALFNPEHLDVDQWMRSLKSAGMTGVILTCKHHDGFCLWPSRLTDHTVASSPYQQGKGDVVAEVSEAARRYGLKFGVYLSPWDRTEPTYGQGTVYDDFYVGQLTELLTQYGPIFSVWLDGANGEGANGKTQYYDWDRYYRVIRALQPDAVISVCGPDVRWAGNEAGHVRAEEWSVVPSALRSAELTAEHSQHEDDGQFSTLVHSQDEDLGSRQAIAEFGDDLVWYPAEVDTSIRPGWFYHSREDAQVKTGEQLFALWKQVVGGNCTLLLNVPPTPEGNLHEADVAALEQLGSLIADFTSREVCSGVQVSASSGQERAPYVITPTCHDDAMQSWYATADDAQQKITLTFDEPTMVEAVVIEEAIACGQRLEQAQLEGVTLEGQVVDLGSTGTVGYRRILDIEPVLLRSISMKILASRGTAMISRFIAVRARS